MFFSTDGETDDWFIKNFDYSIYNSIKMQDYIILLKYLI
jgi:hypothetical protein